MLEKILDHAVAENLISSVGSPEITSDIRYFHVVDDILLCNHSKPRIQNLKFILYAFELISRLKINFSKIRVIGLQLNSDETDAAASLLKCRKGNLPTQYLGLPLHHSKLRTSHWNILIEKIEKKLSAWRRSMPSMAGKLALI